MSIWQGRLSHACIVASPAADERGAAALQMAQATVCRTGGGNSACGVCRDCRKAAAGIHPDVAYVKRALDDKGKPRREITVDQIRALVSDAVILPNEAVGKAFVIEEADLMNPNAQNALLKLLEEPPAYLRLILSTENPENLLPTVRSRCTRYDLNEAGETPDAQALADASRFLEAFQKKDAAALLRFSAESEGGSAAQAAAFLDAVEFLLAKRLRENPQNCAGPDVDGLLALIDKLRSWLRVNVGIKHLFGALCVSAAKMK